MKKIKQRVRLHVMKLASGVAISMKCYAPAIYSSNRIGAKVVGFRDYQILTFEVQVDGDTTITICQEHSDDEYPDTPKYLRALGADPLDLDLVKEVSGQMFAEVKAQPGVEA